MTTLDALADFLDECVLPSEPAFLEAAVTAGPAERPAVMDELRDEARRRGLWNAFLPVGDAARRPQRCCERTSRAVRRAVRF